MKFSKPQEYILTSTQPINLFLAGIGSGKTHLSGVISYFYARNFPDVFGFIGANTYRQLTESTLFRIRKVWKEYFGLIEGRDYVVGVKPPKHFDTSNHEFDDYKGIISFSWGAVAFKGSLDNAKAHDGKEFGWAILDETKDSREADVKDVILGRLRMPGLYVTAAGKVVGEKHTKGAKNRPFMPMYITTSPAKVQWINDWFGLEERQNDILAVIYNKDEFYISEHEDKCVVISSTYHNEENLPDGYIDTQLKNRSAEDGKRLIFGNPFVKTGGEFYSQFDRITHVKDNIEFKPGLAIHLSLDQNVRPYITGTLYQIEDIDKHRYITQFDEICLPNPNNKTQKLCLEFIKRWGSKCKNGLFIYGDPAGRYSDTRGSEHDYDIVFRMLRKYVNNSSDRVPHAHPPVLKRKDFANNAFEGVYKITISIASRCKHSIADFDYLKEDINGKKLKKKVKDDDGNYYEKYGHTSDSFDYFFVESNRRLFEREFML